MIKNRSQQGVTLIEMMIAMVVSLVLVAGIGTVYISSKRNYQARDQFSMMDENARVALNSLKKHLEHAGYASNGLFPLEHPFIEGSQPTSTSCVDGSDVYPNTGRTYYLTQNNAVPGTGVNVRDDGVGIAFLSDDTLFTDCSNGVVPANCRLGKSPSAQASLVYNSFSLDQVDSGDINAAGDVIPALYCSGSASSSKQMIAQGIERLVLLYGVDTNSDGAVDQYQNATDVGTNWPNVISIKVALLVRSLEPVLQTPEQNTYSILDESFTPANPDRYQRAVYTEVIHLRNRV